jgi:SsrA-binding protein
MKIISDNKKARFDFEVLETFEAGIALLGSEVKAIREGGVNLKDAYVVFKGHEAYLHNAHIAVYKASSYNNHEPERQRKLLLNMSELTKINSKIAERGLSCVALKMYFKEGWVKVQIGLARGKKAHDKREAIKNKDVDRDLKNVMKKDRY